MKRYAIKDESPIVSVIVPIYEVEKYLRKCIDSICNQTYKQLEIILVDDGSTDSCGSICDKYSKVDKRIVVIHKKNGGLSSARNAGLDVASGAYIAFVDADDFVHPQFIEILIGLCEKYECDIAQCDFLTISEQSLILPLNSQRSLISYTGKQALHQLCIGKEDVKYIVAWNKLYKRELFYEIRYPLGKIHEDEFTTYRIIWKAKKMIITNQYLYYYLQRPESIMGRKYSVKRLDALEAFRERLDFLKENKLEKEYFATIQKYIDLIERNYKALKDNIENDGDICAILLKEKQQLEEQFPQLPVLEEVFRSRWNIDTCPFPQNARLVLYGAGKWGQAYYQWIIKNHWGIIIGWIDNFWNVIKNLEYPITPLDSVLSMSYDFVLVTIQSKIVQKEIIHNLKCWGVPERKILTI